MMRVMRTGCWSIGLALMVACGPVIPPLPAQGGPAWLELRSEHFTLWTDASAERGRELMHELETRRQLLMTAMNRAPSKARSFVIALRSVRETGVYLPGMAIAASWDARNPTGEPGILLATTSDDDQHVLSHELTHVISFGIIRNQPHWLAEGIATYFEMVDLDFNERSVQIGLPRDDRPATLRASPPVSAARLFACEESRCKEDRFYATSWALFSFVLNQRYDQLGRYLERLNELPDDKQADAWGEAFPDLSLDQLDDELSGWLRSGKLRLPRIDVTVHDVPVRESRLGDADVLAVRSLLNFKFKDVGAAHVAAEDALAIQRTNLLARLINTELTHEIAPTDARATAAAYPDDWRAWRLVELALKDQPEAEAARNRVCALTGNEAPGCAHSGPR
jgi:Protein of unknown function (DUF1570)